MKRVLVLIVFVCFPLLYAGAQSTAQISGTVQDSSGAAVAGAQVQVTNVDTNATRTAQTSDDGAYLFPSLAIGPYRLQVTKEGFVTYAQTGIVLQVNSNPAIDVTLQIGAVTQTVEVHANAAMVETQSNAGLGLVIQPEQILDLPLNGRQANVLVLSSGAAVNNTGVGGVQNNLDYPGSVAYSVAGSQGNATNYFLDGAVNMDFRTNIGLPLPFPDALQEFKVESSALSASAGNHPGGAVNAATKSGSNSFHGDAFDFLRNTVMDARVDFTGLKDQLKRNQFGGVIGGPIKKDKVFFFYGFQGTQERILGPNSTTAFVPTKQSLAGDFTTILSSACQATPLFLNDTIPSPTGGPAQALVTAHHSNILAPGWLSTPSAVIASKFAAFLPTPTDQACGKILYTPFTSDHEYQHVIRTDWQRTSSDTIFGRYFFTNYTLLPFYQPGNILTAGAPGLNDRFQSVDIGDTHILSAQMISSLRLSFTRTATVRTGPPGIPTWQSLGSNVTTQVPFYTGQNSVSGYFTPTEPAFPGYDYENMFGISESLSWTRGSHQMIFGFSGMHVQMNNDGLFQVNPNFTFSTGSASYTGSPLADFLTGNIDSYAQGNGQLGREGQNLPSLYFQDNWKMTRHFQLNYGLRWDPFIPQHNKYHQESDFNLAAYNAGSVSKVYVNAPPGLTFPGDAGFHGDSPTNSRLWDFSPRVGIVWDPRGRGLETIRAGYGIFYDTSVLWNTMHIVLNPPWGETLKFTPSTVLLGGAANSGGGTANPWFNVAGGNPFPTPLNPPSTFAFPQNGTFVFEDQNIHPTNSQQWNLALQKQFGGNWLVSATYLGSKTTHQWLGTNIDPSVIISAGMTAPGIVSTAGMTGTSGPCTLRYGSSTITYPTCNSSSTTTVSGVTNENARRALVLANPVAGPAFSGGAIMDGSIGNSAYNGLLVSVQHRLSQNFSISTNFTWSRCMDDGEIGQDIGNAFQDPSNRKADWGPCAADRRKIFNLSMVVQSPKYESHWVQTFAGNWQASGIFTATSGAWLNVTDGSDVSLTGVGSDRPNQVGNPFAPGTVSANPTCVAPAAVHTLAHWFNPCAYLKQSALTFGNTSRNSLLGPGNWNFDAAIWRTFPITEGLKLDFRAEAFNAFNHLWTPNPNSTALSSGTIGSITSPATGTNARLMQLALKLTF
jgi:hypothetical protein